ncbi:hypothetical protein CRU87_06140 [Aliarcobacter trophiarum LMG 25534]|uniref:Chemotaxis protein n=2 Tax=Aliarcobacter trophiarum TaxID=708186 RepID=A0AAD0VMQ9_9BACT|nr:hypothetical protein [Aliarcobacter trophiarum]AXK49489.1 hypothetical protein ATR_1661 [Aliarcobacter trophiarum LMG 25534]RXI27953.1 hypothetical protein CRU89_03985 [Aliarcobacter trophiarum]RXJ91269.1 hypothetical protein CRU87_06140 [Aliarcobacter trophiarum LMG 25534]
MSMSQEDIEALMNGLDIPAQDSAEVTKEEAVEEEKVNTKEIEELLLQVEKSEEKESVVPATEKKISEIGELLNDIEDGILTEDNVLDAKDSLEKEEVINKSKTDDDIVKEWSSSKISEGVFPFPAENDTKVVSQLSQVANDSEEKVSQIFDVLSLTLDNNTEVRKKIKEYEEFILSQNKLLNSLSNKFPKIGVFQEQLDKVKSFESSIKGLKTLLDDEDMHIFQGMELMQFNDINRQKIERVMSVIRKLSIYLNNLFEDENPKDLPMARHIHGDKDTEDLVGDDLDKLIAEFNK